MPGGSGGSGRFGFDDWSDREFRDWFTAIIGEGGRKNNTYKFAMARLLLDLCCDPCMMLRTYGRLGDRAGAGAGYLATAQAVDVVLEADKVTRNRSTICRRPA